MNQPDSNKELEINIREVVLYSILHLYIEIVNFLLSKSDDFHLMLPFNAGKSHVLTVLLFPWSIYFAVFIPFFIFTRPGKSFWFVQQVTLGKVLKAIVVMRSLFIDRTIVRGFSENIYNEDGKVRLFYIYS